MGIVNRIVHAWNAFVNLDHQDPFYSSSVSYGQKPDRTRLRYANERSIISSIYNRMAVDVADLDVKHVRLDDQERFDSVIKSALNECLTLKANLDQSAKAFIQDAVLTMFDEGVIAIVPVDTTINPKTGSFDIQTMRVGRVVRWEASRVLVNTYNEKTGKREDVPIDKENVAIVENPFYTVMNESNSTLQRLTRKLALLDVVDEQSSSGKLDMIIQLPYTIKSQARRDQAEQRRKDIEFQLKGSQYGIAYTDGTEKITQLNRPSENNLLKQVEYLTKMLYTQLGITEEIMNGSAAPEVMIAYHNRTIKPIINAIVLAMSIAFLTKTGRTQGQKIVFFYDPFAIIPIKDLAEIVDKLTRNEVLTSNEVRQIIGRAPSKEAKADKLQNSNMPNDKRGLDGAQQPVKRVPSVRVDPAQIEPPS